MICPDRCTMELWGTYQGIKINEVYKCRHCTVTSYRSVEMDKEQLIAEMAVENAELREQIRARDAELERVRKACNDLLEYAVHASVESGYCMCGDSMENHSGMDHAPVDAGEYGLGQVIEQAQATLASPAGEPLLAHDEELLEQLFWDFDAQHKRDGQQRLAFKGKLRWYAEHYAQQAPATEAALSPEVLAFARLMQQKLDANAHKGGWQNDTLPSLMDRLTEEARELEHEIEMCNHRHVIALEAADVANFAMMIADKVGALQTKPVPDTETSPPKKTPWTMVTGPGQVKPNDWLCFTLSGEFFCVQAKKVLQAGTEDEEVVYNRSKNHYFITSMVVDGSSSHKNVMVASSGAPVAQSEPSQSDTICDSECTWRDHSPRCIAAKWREQNGYVGKGGVVTVFDDQVCGWTNELRNPEHWTPGAIAVDESGNQWEARGGDEQSGALRWEPVAQSQEGGGND